MRGRPGTRQQREDVPPGWYLERLLGDYSNWFMGAARRYEAQKRQLTRIEPPLDDVLDRVLP